MDISFLYLFVGVFVFFFCFFVVYSHLKKINTVEGEKFSLEDWGSCFSFGAMFSLTFVFILNISFEAVDDKLPFSTPNIAGYLLLAMISILIIYPLWEIIFLGRPTSDSVHEFHRFIETKILDRFSGKMAYFVSFLIFILVYLCPVFIIYLIFPDYKVGEILFMWFLIFPLFFLSYYAAIGHGATILKKTYKNIHYLLPNKRNVVVGSHSPFSRMWYFLKILIYASPFLLAIYNIYSPISDLISGAALKEKAELAAYIALVTTVVFGVRGFYSKFWSKKSKTKAIDFIFSGYIFIAIGVSMLINFVAIDQTLVESILGVELFGFKPLVEFGIYSVFQNYYVLLPLILVQSVIIVLYGGYLLLDKKSDFQADIKLSAVESSYRLMKVEELRKHPERINKKKSYDLSTLVKSALLAPIYNKYGIDINKPVRSKASQYLLLICSENRNKTELVHQVIDIISKNTIEKKRGEYLYLSKEAVDLLGNIGKILGYSDYILEKLTKSLAKTKDNQIKSYILDALGDVGEKAENLDKVLEVVSPLLCDLQYIIRRAAASSIVEMILEGQNRDKKFVNDALDAFYQILDQHFDSEEYIETTLEAILSCSSKVAKDILYDKIKSFLDYKKDTDDPKTVDYILEYAIAILARIVYYNLDKFPKDLILNYLDDSRSFIRYVASDALGNYILKRPDDIILEALLSHSISDRDIDVAEMCVESVSEFIILHKDYKVVKEGRKVSILDYYLSALDKKDLSEYASEALKSIAPLYSKNIWPILSEKIQGNNLEVARDCIHTVALLDKKIHQNVDLNLFYSMTNHKDPTVRAEAAYALGMIAVNRSDVDENILLKRLEDEDPTVRLETIFALANLGKKKSKIAPILIDKYLDLARSYKSRVSEIELYAESLGEVGSVYPYNEIIIALQRTLLGDVNPFTKDVIVRSLNNIGMGLVKSGKATKRIGEKLANTGFLSGAKKEYTIGNLVVIMIEALQQKGIPQSIMDQISDALQDLLPVFITSKQGGFQENIILRNIKLMLSQAYYSNYNQKILETIDRVDSILNFNGYFETDVEFLKELFLFFSKQYTLDGKQFYDQGDLFLLIAERDESFLDYALRSYQVAIELSPNEYFTPNCHLKIAEIYMRQKKYSKAQEKFSEALAVFTSLDDVQKMKEIENSLKKI